MGWFSSVWQRRFPYWSIKKTATHNNTVDRKNFRSHSLLKEWINHNEITKAITIPTNGAKKIKATVLRTGSEVLTALQNSDAGNRSACKIPDQCMRRRRRNSQPPGQKVPAYCSDKPWKIITIISLPAIPSWVHRFPDAYQLPHDL